MNKAIRCIEVSVSRTGGGLQDGEEGEYWTGVNDKSIGNHHVVASKSQKVLLQTISLVWHLRPPALSLMLAGRLFRTFRLCSRLCGEFQVVPPDQLRLRQDPMTNL